MMHGAGVRLSECFHLWFGDVQEHPLDPTIAWVRIGHPTHGLTKWTVDGADFRDDPKASSEGKLEAIQMAWLEER